MLTPKVKLSCPICGIELKCQVREVNQNDASWAFTEQSYNHLKAANCIKPQTVVLLGEDFIPCKEAA